MSSSANQTSGSAGPKLNYYAIWKESLKTYSPTLSKLDDTTLKSIFYDVGPNEIAQQIEKVRAANPTVTSNAKLYQIIGQEWENSVLIDASLKKQQSDYAQKHLGQQLPDTMPDYYDPTASKPAASTMSSFERAARDNSNLVAGQGNVPGTNIPGKGTVTAAGTLTRGITENVGGGKLATEVRQNEQGDYIAQGPQSVDVAQQILRPKFVVAGGEDVRPTVQADAQSNAIFESFSIVPDGYGLGPDNRLHLLNKQNDVIRYGVESMYEPRVDAPITPAHPIPPQWKESMSLQELEEAYATKIGLEMLKARGISIAQSNPLGVLEDDYNRIPSSKGLVRQTRGPSPFMPTVFNLEDFLPARDPPGLQMNSIDRTDSLRGTFGYRRKRVFDSLRPSW